MWGKAEGLDVVAGVVGEVAGETEEGFIEVVAHLGLLLHDGLVHCVTGQSHSGGLLVESSG